MIFRDPTRGLVFAGINNTSPLRSDAGLRATRFGVGPDCRVLGWSESAYHAHRKRPKSARRLP